MDFHSWPRHGPGHRRGCRPAVEPAATVDPDRWVELANGDDPLDPGGLRSGVGGAADAASVEELTDRFEAILDGGTERFVPPSAARMTAQQWAALPHRMRAALARRYLRTLDPRLLPRAILCWTGRRRTRHSHH